MTPDNEEVLVKLIEKCSETIKAATKVLTYGMTNWHPDTGVKNSDTLMKNLLELEALCGNTKELVPAPTIEEMAEVVEEWFARSSLRERAEFETTRFDQLVVFHSTLGRQIRNYFNLWAYPWNKKIVNGVDVANDHPDSVSMRVIEEVWRRVNAS